MCKYLHACKIQNIYLVITIEIYSHMYCSSLDFCCCFELLIFPENSQQWKLMWEQPAIYLSLPSSVLNKCILWESQIILTFTKPLGFRENSLFIVLKLFWLRITHMESKLVLKPKVKKSIDSPKQRSRVNRMGRRFTGWRDKDSSSARPPSPSPTPRVYTNSWPLSRWCHPTISSSVVSFSSCPQSFPVSESFPMSWLF